MKTKILFIIFTIIAVFTSCNSQYEQEVLLDETQNEIKEEPNGSKKELYPSPDKWEYSKPSNPMYAALLIPEDKLPLMSTQELVEACMTYSYGPDCFCFNNYQMGIATVVCRFNGFAELKKHEDAFDKVLEYYNKRLDYIVTITDSEKISLERLSLYYNEQFIISGYLLPVDQLKNCQKLINLYHKAENLRNNYKEFGGCTSLNSLYSMKVALGLE
ncbi:MAG: hypothetical protein K2I94_01435 [Muribaculaceae bacterium]|nr:hypothetical protein [Muribaculaceae bacterium]